MDLDDRKPGSAGTSFAQHPLRRAVLHEIHARPFTPLLPAQRALRYAFVTDREEAARDRQSLSEFCEHHSLAKPDLAAKHHQVAIGDVLLRWEQHSEFTTYTWAWPTRNREAAVPFAPIDAETRAIVGSIAQPGLLLVAVDLHAMPESAVPVVAHAVFDPACLAMTEVKNGDAVLATDFRADSTDHVRILVLDRGMTPERAGALIQRALELETYRTLALLGLPEALKLGPSVDGIGHRLAEVMDEMKGAEGLKANNRLLDELTELAAALEGGAASSLFRFGASRAYHEIVQLRLATIEGREVSGFPSWSSFLRRRMAPAMRTCATMEERQANLSRKLARAADLLRTRVDIELERQNRDLLRSMNERTRLQLRLQSTVEGLSVAAIGYYVVSLFGYLAKAAHEAGLPIDPVYATAAFVPLALAVIWFTVRRIRKSHLVGPEAGAATVNPH